MPSPTYNPPTDCPPGVQHPAPPTDPDYPQAWFEAYTSMFATSVFPQLDLTATLASQPNYDAYVHPIDPYGRRWLADRCGVAQCTVQYRPSEVLRSGDVGISRAQLQTMTPIRAIDPLIGAADPTVEQCLYHRCFSGVAANGRRRGIMCSGDNVFTGGGVPQSPGVSYGQLATRATQDNIGRAGRARVLIGFRTPRTVGLIQDSPGCFSEVQDLGNGNCGTCDEAI